MEFETTRLAIAEFLNRTILDWGILYLDFWSVGHLIFGFVTFIIVVKIMNDNSRFSRHFLLTYLILFAWEVVEFTCIKFNVFYNGLPLFNTEGGLGIITDLIAGIIGAYLCKILLFNEEDIRQHCREGTSEMKHFSSDIKSS